MGHRITRDFLLYNMGQFLSQFADRLIQMALIGVVYRHFQSSSAQLAKLLLFTLLPAFVISPVAGVYVDKWRKKNVLVWSSLGMAVLVCLIPVFFLDSGSTASLYALVFLIFMCACFFLPAKLSIIPELVPQGDFLSANSVAAMVWILGGLFGFTLGGFIIEAIGPKNGLYLNAALYLVSAVTLSFMRSAQIKHERLGLAPVIEKLKSAKHFVTLLKEGFSHVAMDPHARTIGTIFFIASSVAGALYVVGIVFIQELSGTMTSRLGLFGIFVGAGFLLGSFLIGKLGSRASRTRMIFGAFIMSRLCVAAFALAAKAPERMIIADLVLFLLGLSISPIMTAGNTFIHEEVGEELRGRVFSSIGIVMNAGFAVFMWIAGCAAERAGNFAVIIICGLVLVAAGAAGRIFYRGK